MTTQSQIQLVSRFGRIGALLVVAAVLPACGGDSLDVSEEEDVAEAEQAEGYGGTNNLPPSAIDSDSLARGITNSFGITSPSVADPIQLCANGSVTSGGCTLKQEWANWVSADSTNRAPLMKAITKCSVASTFSIQDPNASRMYPGQWELYPGWKTGRLTGQDKRERVSSCILTLLNGNNQELLLCIIGPGGSPFSDACNDTRINLREGGFFGDLFAATPTAYVAGPDTADPLDTGRACTSTQESYCCAENDTSCGHRIVLAGAILGSPDQNYANKRCNGSLVNAGGNAYCTSYFSTREPGRSYTNMFTTFVPSGL